MSVVLEPARPDDAAALVAILSGWIDETPWMPRVHDADAMAGFGSLLIERTEVWVARNGRDVVGFLALQGELVQALYLAPHARGRGIGRRLLGEAKRRRQRLGLWTFQANEAARRFYRHNGFVEREMTDGAKNDEHLPDVYMVWEGTGQ